jgi:SH3-like domain-containing protein
MPTKLPFRRFAALLPLLALAACGARGGEGADCSSNGPGGKASTPSGYCVPRYLSLKRGEVFGRKGPGKDYPAAFVYHARGLPVQVIDESTDWRRICDPDGGSVWISAAMVDGHRTVMAIGAAAIPLREKPADNAAAVAYLRPRAIADLGRAQGDWRQVSAGGASGWVKSSEVWGLAPQPQCR